MAQVADATFRYRLREAIARVWRITIPNDRPSPIFTFFSVILNAVEITRGFEVVLSSDCSVPRQRWCVLGTTNSIVNMMYAILIMWQTRRRIDKGIPLYSSTLRIFFSEPLNIAFMVYVLWEIVWMSLVTRIGNESLDKCAMHLSLQLGFSSAFLILGMGLLFLTFMTEFSKTPRWRIWANEKSQKRRRVASLAFEEHQFPMHGVTRDALGERRVPTSTAPSTSQADGMSTSHKRVSHTSNDITDETQPSCFLPRENNGSGLDIAAANARTPSIKGNPFPPLRSVAPSAPAWFPAGEEGGAFSPVGNVVSELGRANEEVTDRGNGTPSQVLGHESVVLRFSVRGSLEASGKEKHLECSGKVEEDNNGDEEPPKKRK